MARHGGQLLRNLERPVRVTHLLCSGDVETEKMRYAEKFNKSGEAQISLVWEEWFWDTLDSHGEFYPAVCCLLPRRVLDASHKGRFDEDTYQVRNPRPERKKILEDREQSNVVPRGRRELIVLMLQPPHHLHDHHHLHRPGRNNSDPHQRKNLKLQLRHHLKVTMTRKKKSLPTLRRSPP